jgi:rubrerythrin
MRVDISQDPKATHYCKYCGYTMKARAELMCPVRDGDFCEAKKRERRVTPRAKATGK